MVISLREMEKKNANQKLSNVHILAASFHQSAPASPVPRANARPAFLRRNTLNPDKYGDQRKIGISDIMARDEVPVAIFASVLIHNRCKECKTFANLLPLLFAVRTWWIWVRRRMTSEEVCLAALWEPASAEGNHEWE